MAKPSSKRQQAELRAVFKLMGRAFAEFLMDVEEATTDWQLATAMIIRLQPHMTSTDWQRFAVAVKWPYGDIEEPDAPERPSASRAAARKPALH